MPVTITTALQNAGCDAMIDSVDAGAGAAGSLQIRSGSRPASANDAATGTLLATVTLQNPAFDASASGTKIVNDPGPVTGSADGTATWARFLDSDGNTCFDGSVTATGGGGDVELNTTTISTGVNFDITGGSVTMPPGTV